MTKHDQELLEKQLWGVSSRPSQNGTIILTIVAVFLAGIGIGDKTKQANTNYAQANANYAAAIPRITDALP
jgi:predicted RND superfamily exporter protein